MWGDGQCRTRRRARQAAEARSLWNARTGRCRPVGLGFEFGASGLRAAWAALWCLPVGARAAGAPGSGHDGCGAGGVRSSPWMDAGVEGQVACSRARWEPKLLPALCTVCMGRGVGGEQGRDTRGGGHDGGDEGGIPNSGSFSWASLGWAWASSGLVGKKGGRHLDCLGYRPPQTPSCKSKP